MAKRRGHGDGSIFPVKDKEGRVIRWGASIDLGIVNGKRRRKTVYDKTQAGVRQKLRVLQRKQERGVDLSKQNITVAAFLQLWLDGVVRPHRRPTTLKSYADAVRLYINPHLGTCQLGKLTPAMVQQWVNTLTETGIRRKAQYARAVLQRALNRAVRFEYIERNPVLATDPPRVVKRPIDPLTRDQARRLLKAVEGHRLELLYHLAVNLGMRRGELLALRWEDISFREQTLQITGSIQRVGGKIERSLPKTEAGARTLPLTRQIVIGLAMLKEKQAEDRIIKADDWEEHDLVFPSERGTPIEPTNLHRHFKRALIIAELSTTFRIHDLRHTAATFMVARGVHPKIVADILGHTKIALTMDLYSHSMPENVREAVKIVADWLEETDTQE